MLTNLAVKSLFAGYGVTEQEQTKNKLLLRHFVKPAKTF